ncbi:MAG: sulfatase [Thermoguttaceae bacterium]|nr:sulfatase [Thermoguttaceae bacterium]
MRPTTAILLVLAGLGGASGSARAAVAQPQARKPNVVFILADDLGWTDVACYGSRYYETPHIDRLAAEGMRFTHGYTCGPNCQPTRAALMTGQYGPRTGIYTVGGTDRFDTSMRPLVPVENVTKLAPEKTTWAEALRRAGYATGLFGKWHLGEDPKHHPLAQGFDEAIVSMGRHFDFKTNPKAEVPPGAYLADFLTDRAIGFIERHKDRPFLLCLHHFAVHSPYQAKDGKIARFQGKPPAGGHNSPVYAAMISSLDDSVGRVVARLDELGLSPNTLVVFTSDNGGVGGYVAAGVKTKEGITDNAPLRGGKGMLYEGGVRVPFIFRWPGRIKAQTVCDEPIVSVDLFPTLLDLSGAPAPENQPLDGLSLVPLFDGGGSARLGRDAIYWHFPGYLGSGPNIWRTTPAGAIRVGDYKLIEFFEDGRRELYNLRDDPGQQRDLAKEQPERARDLHAKLAAWRQQVKAPMPTPRAVGGDQSPTKKAKSTPDGQKPRRRAKSKPVSS